MTRGRNVMPELSCPRCGGEALEIVYGYPGPDLFEASERGDVVLGGCIIEVDQPTASCTVCHHAWAAA